MVPQEGVQVNEYSTTRRTVTGVLVLIVAGLLGYVLYDNLLNTSQSVPVEIIETELAPTSDDVTYGLLDNPNRTLNGESLEVTPEDLSHAMSNNSSEIEVVEDDRMLQLLQ